MDTGKTSSFGIGELGGVPESTPYDDMVADEIRSRQPKKTPSKNVEIINVSLRENVWHVEEKQGVDHGYQIVDLESKNNKTFYFETLDEMIQFVKIYCTGSSYEHLSLYAPGYTVGSCLTVPGGGSHRLTWRRMLKSAEPITGCDECGGDVRNGRCVQCGETDMISTSWNTWDNHEEIIYS